MQNIDLHVCLLQVLLPRVGGGGDGGGHELVHEVGEDGEHVNDVHGALCNYHH